MRYLKTKNQYKASNVMLDMNEYSAWSYDWWQFLRKENGRTYFNDTSYSSSTNRHQSKVWAVLGYCSFDVTLRYTRRSLSDLDAALEDEIRECDSRMDSLKQELAKPRIRDIKGRLDRIKNLLHHRGAILEELKRFKASSVA